MIAGLSGLQHDIIIEDFIVTRKRRSEATITSDRDRSIP